MNHRDLRKRTYGYPVEFFKKSILKNCHLDLGNRVDLLYSGLVSNKDQLVLLDRVSLIEKFEKNEAVVTLYSEKVYNLEEAKETLVHLPLFR